MTKVLVVATSPKTQGGIAAVVKAHQTGPQWKRFHCKWIATTRNGPAWRKLWYCVTALLEYAALLPFYDIVHIHLTAETSARRKKIFFEMAKLLHKKTILHYHSSSTQSRKLLYNMFSRTDLLIVLSEQWRQWIKKEMGLTKKITVLYNPCPSVHLRSCEKEKTILFAGSILQQKGYADLIKAFAKIAAAHKDWKLVIAGNGEIHQAKALCDSYGISSQVELPGWVSGGLKEALFNRAAVFCLPSYSEGFPMAVLDAWAYGLPCVVTPVGGLPDVVRNGENALTFPVGDVDGLAMQLEKIISDKHLREKIAAASLHLAHTTFNIENINKKLSDIYTELCNKDTTC